MRRLLPSRRAVQREGYQGQRRCWKWHLSDIRQPRAVAVDSFINKASKNDFGELYIPKHQQKSNTHDIIRYKTLSNRWNTPRRDINYAHSLQRNPTSQLANIWQLLIAFLISWRTCWQLCEQNWTRTIFLVWSGAEVRKSCTSQEMLQNKQLLANINFDEA